MAGGGTEPQKLEVISEPMANRKDFGHTVLRKYFEAAVKLEGSDLLLRTGQVPKLRVRGSLKSLGTEIITGEQFEESIQKALSPGKLQFFMETGQLDAGFDLNMGESGMHRFRVNIFRTRGRAAIAARRVSNKILGFSQLYLPPVMAKISEYPQGLVLLCGVTGSGKSTTIAAILQHINETKACHILTIEDPIEYLFTDAKSMVNQREVGIDVPSFPLALKALVRENPDVVLIGEMRDRETFEAALHAAETGHLVFGTIHASSTSQAFNRIYDLFSHEERPAIRNMLAYQMRAFVYQKLLPTIREDMQRVPAVEILIHSTPTTKYILDGREHELNQVVKNSREMGMQTFTDSLVDLVNKAYIHQRVALENASNPEELKMRLKGIISSSG